MIPKLYKSSELLFKTNGLGSLADCISCVVTEEVNGAYELEMEYPVNGLHYNELQTGRIVYAKPNETSEPQPFDIKEITSSMDDMSVTIYATHIRYRLNGVPVNPFSAVGIAEALNGLIQHSKFSTPFTVWTDIGNTTTEFKVEEIKTFGSLLGGTDGSILDTFTGSTSYAYEFDKYNIKLWKDRGANHGVSIRYAKNLTGCEMETNIESVYTGVLAYYKSDEISLESDIQYVDKHESYPNENIYLYDCSSEFDSDTTPTVEELNNKAKAYIKANDIGTPSVSIDVNFVPLWQTEEYKNVAPLERVSLCDTVSVVFNDLGINASARVNKTEYDVLNERYNEITLGSVKSNMADTVKQMITDKTGDALDSKFNTINGKIGSLSSKITQTGKTAQEALDEAVAKIKGGTNGHVVLKTNANGETNELYAYDGDTLESASKVLRLNYEGIAGTDNGVSGTYNVAITTDGHINANMITVGELDGAIIKANSIFADRLNLTFGTDTTMTLGGNTTGALFKGTGTFELDSVGNFNFKNYADSDYSRLKNKIYTSTFKNGSYYTQGMWLDNYQYGITNIANFLFMQGLENSNWTGFANKMVGNSTTANELQLRSYSDSWYSSLENYKDATYYANRLYLGKGTSNNSAYITNWQFDNTNSANTLNFNANATTNSCYLNNYQIGTKKTANYIWFTATSSGHNMYLWNYQLNSSNLANDFYLSANSTRNYCSFRNKRFGYSTDTNWVAMSSSDSETSVAITNRFKDETRNYISMNATDSATTMSIVNQNGSILFKEDQNVDFTAKFALNLKSTSWYVIIQSNGIAKRCVWQKLNDSSGNLRWYLTGEDIQS